MEENNYNEQFKDLTKGMEVEKIYDALAERAEFVRVLTLHCGEIFKAARESGIPRAIAERMAMEYFNYEVQPAGVTYLVGGEGEQ